MSESETVTVPHAIVITVSDIPETPPCCQRAHERGYRRGYKDGYTYAFCDAGQHLSETIWQRFWRFREEQLLPWMRKTWGAGVVSKLEGGPRLSREAQRRPARAPKQGT